MDNKAFFITGTGTGIGKTIASSLLVKYFILNNKKTIYYKPVETGNEKFNAVGEDVSFVCKNNPLLNSNAQGLMQNFLFKLPASPHLSAKLDNSYVDVNVIKDHYLKLIDDFDIVICEGAGGILVPLNESFLTVDLIKMMGVPVIIVAPAGLGMINHTLMTLQVLRNYGIKIFGIVINNYPAKPGIIEEDNLETVEKFGKARILAKIPELSKVEDIDSLNVKDIFKNINF